MSNNFIIKNVKLVGSFENDSMAPIVSVVPNIHVPPCSKDKLFEIIQFMFNESKKNFANYNFSSLVMTFEYANINSMGAIQNMNYGFDKSGIVAVA